MPNNSPLPDWLYEIIQAPHNERKAAGQVVTPGPVDWGGMQQDIYNFAQQPYRDRLAREAQAAIPVSASPAAGLPLVGRDAPLQPMPPVQKFTAGAYKTTGAPPGTTAGAAIMAAPRPPSIPDPLNGVAYGADQYPTAWPSLLASPKVAANVPAGPVKQGGTTYYPKGSEYGYNAVTGDYEVKQPGQAYASVPAPTFAPRKPAAVQAIEVATAAGGMPAMPRPPRPATAPGYGPPIVSAQANTSGRKGYAGLSYADAPPSLIPAMQGRGILDMVLQSADLNSNPFKRFFAGLMAGGPAAPVRPGMMNTMSGGGSNFPLQYAISQAGNPGGGIGTNVNTPSGLTGGRDASS